MGNRRMFIASVEREAALLRGWEMAFFGTEDGSPGLTLRISVRFTHACARIEWTDEIGAYTETHECAVADAADYVRGLFSGLGAEEAPEGSQGPAARRKQAEPEQQLDLL